MQTIGELTHELLGDPAMALIAALPATCFADISRDALDEILHYLPDRRKGHSDDYIAKLVARSVKFCDMRPAQRYLLFRIPSFDHSAVYIKYIGDNLIAIHNQHISLYNGEHRLTCQVAFRGHAGQFRYLGNGVIASVAYRGDWFCIEHNIIQLYKPIGEEIYNLWHGFGKRILPCGMVVSNYILYTDSSSYTIVPKLFSKNTIVDDFGELYTVTGMIARLSCSAVKFHKC